ncbi:MAG: FtsX-like permease family protein [Treponema sp.]|nr:FtsX-like permease family protein [Treponema sp.]
MTNEHGHGGTGALVKIAYRNIWRNKRRTFFCLTAVGFAVFFIAFYGGFIEGFSRNINDIVHIFDTGHVRVVSAEFEDDFEFMPVQFPVSDGRDVVELVDLIKANVPGVKAVLPRIETFASLHESAIRHAMLWGLKVEREMELNNFNLINRDSGLIEGSWPRPGSNDAAIGWSLAQRTGLGIGDYIPLSTMSAQFSDRPWEPRVTGIFGFDYMRFDENYIIVDFERLQRLLVLGGGTQQLVIFADDERLSPLVAHGVERLLGEGNVVQDWQENIWVDIMNMARPMYILIYLVFLVVACLLIINTVVMIIHERIKEIGMMGSLGMSRREIVTVFFFESVFMSAIGALAGVVVGGIVTGIGQFFPFRWTDMTGNTFAQFPAADAIFLDFSIVSLAQAWFMGVIVASVFTLIPSLKSAFVEPVEALRR